MNAPAKNEASRQRRRPHNNHNVSPARETAFAVLRRVEEEGAFASVLLAKSDEQLRAEDRALCYELVLGVLRRQLWLDYLIEHYAGRAASRIDAPVRLALRLGLYQLRFLQRVPARAAVNESVNLAHHMRLRSATSFINAVLRRATREPDFDPTANIADPIKRLSIKTSHPSWLIERWARAFGSDDASAFAHANNETPPVAFRIVPVLQAVDVSVNSEGKADNANEILSKLRAAGGEIKPSKIAPDAWRIEGASSVLRELTRAGRIYIQDEASQLVAHVLNAQAHERVLDVCAAPGSKTTHSAARAYDQALIVAGDVREGRLQLVRESCARQRLKNVRLVALNAVTALPFANDSFDRVLVDAPCTGTGTLRRNPEIRWRITEADIAELATRQRLILANAARMVRRDGYLLYSTCSVEPEENEAIVERFLQETPCFKQLSTKTGEPLQLGSGATRTWPQRDGADGFFIALFERVN